MGGERRGISWFAALQRWFFPLSSFPFSFILTRMVISQKYLSDDASAAVLDLLPASANGDLASVCSWADHVRFRYRWASPLHYIDTPEVCDYEYSSPHFFFSFLNFFPHFRPDFWSFRNAGDCHNPRGDRDMCVAGAINNYTAQLQTYTDSHRIGCKHYKPLNSFWTNRFYLIQSKSVWNVFFSFPPDNLTESLMFLAHFMGDIHQPLHVSFADDEGGNSIIVHWYRRKSNLHHVSKHLISFIHTWSN